MSENYLSFQQREKCFLLTSPFIEPGLRDDKRSTLRFAYSPCSFGFWN